MSAIDITGYLYTYPKGRFQERIKEVQFGLGFDQRASDGINSRIHEWDVTFPAIANAPNPQNTDLVSLMDALLTADDVFWISPYDIAKAQADGMIPSGLIWSELSVSQTNSIKKPYKLEGELEYQTLNDRLVSLSCRLKRVYRMN